MTSGNILFLYDSISDRPKHRWHATGVASEWVRFDAGAGKTLDIDAVAFVGHNGTVQATVRTRMSDLGDLSSPKVDRSDELWPPTYGLGENFGQYFGGYPDLTAFAQFTYFRVLRLSAQTSARYADFLFADPTNAEGSFKLGRVMAGLGWQASRNFEFGWSYRYDDPSPVEETDGGGIIANRKPKPREFKISIGSRVLPLTEALSYADDMLRICGTTRPVLMAMFPEGSRNRIYRTSVYGRFVQPAAIVGHHYELGQVAELTLRELL